MIKERDVVSLLIPFPDINTPLAKYPHMYICNQAGSTKKFVKCQTKKPYHLRRDSEPKKRITEKADITRNPFNNETIIDCDKNFILIGTSINLNARTSNRPDVCKELYDSVLCELNHRELNLHTFEIDEIKHLNNRKVSSFASPPDRKAGN